MADISQELKKRLFGAGPKSQHNWASWAGAAGAACLLLGIIGDSINRTLGLESSNWMLLGIAIWIFSTWGWFAAYFAAKEG